MELQKQNILFIGRATQQAGAENVILQLCEILNPCVNKIVVCAANGFNTKVLSDIGIKFYSIPDIEKKDPGTIFKVVSTINKIVKKEKITVIHTHHRMAAFYVSLLGLYKKSTFIATSHNTFYDKKALTRFTYKHCNVIACGEMVKWNLVDYFGLPDNQVAVIHNAVKPFVGEIIEDELVKQLHEDGCFVIGNIGRLSEQKGMEYYIQAIPKIVEVCPQVRFVIAGNGEDESKLKELSKNLGVDKYLTFLGYRNDVQNLMSQLDLIVLSSLWEGLPLTPIEAFSVGKTVVATAVDGTPEIVKDGENGLLVEAKSPDQIAQKVIWMIKNKQEKKMMELNAIRTFEEEFSFKVFTNTVLDYYRGL